ncbi:hypothetical protein [Marinicella litoralis]|uniref:DUF485 domain-containing protein n=1 Tax=Marinicella litoralis TaxID=644220 RepID=A0A4R6X9E5_9GAMM|nr:hypothetical protein [Marinicella litoralis]TDR14659.1 hypothetical protein C8D91_2930 [Marinicella litoralis]
MNQPSASNKILTAHQRLIKGLKAIAGLMATVFIMIYGLILTTNFITQLNPLNPGVIYLATGLSYGLLALTIVVLLLYAGKSMTQAFSGIEK